MLPCPKCNYDNELGRIFCHQCGTKLDLDAIKPPSRGGKPLKRKGSGGAGKVIGWAVRLVILGALVVVIALMAQVPRVEPIASTSKDLESFYRKRSTLENATFAQKPVEVVLTEAELQAFLQNLQFDKPEGGGVAVELDRLQVNLGGQEIQLHLQGKIHVGGSWEKQLAFSLTGRPATADGRFRLEPKSATIGKLPLPLLVLNRTDFIQGYFKQIFQRMSTEQQLLDKLSSITLEKGQALLEYKPGSGQPAP